MEEAGIGAQNRLFDHEKKALYTMSMSDLYSLSVFSELAFLQACVVEPGSENAEVGHSKKCADAISFVGSCSKLITPIWHRPKSNRDSPATVTAFEADSGRVYVSSVQRSVEDHLNRVRLICAMSDNDAAALHDPHISSQRRNVLSRLHRECHLAIKTLDRPNVHRLDELAYCTLPMIGHMSFVGELVLEKTHQCLKRALKQSNNKNAHIFSMLSVAVDDWQGRLTSVISDALKEDKRSLFACYRLLFGREVILSLEGNLTLPQQREVLRAVGPEQCLRDELRIQAKSVLSSVHDISNSLSWSMQRGNDPDAGTNSSNLRISLIEQIRKAFRYDCSSTEIEVALGIMSSFETVLLGLLFVEAMSCKSCAASPKMCPFILLFCSGKLF